MAFLEECQFRFCTGRLRTALQIHSRERLPASQRDMRRRAARKSGSRLAIELMVMCWWVTFGFLLVSTRALAQSAVRDTASSNSTSEILRPGDIIRLRIWREPDLSGDFPVNDAGEATLPRLGPVAVGSLTPDSLKHFLVTSFATYLRNPSVEVTILRRITVLGAVRSPGVYSADPTMTVGEVLALAGGVAGDGKRDRIQLIRQGTPLELDLKPGTRMINTALRSGDQLYVPQRSWLSRNLPWVVGLGFSVTGLLIRVL